MLTKNDFIIKEDSWLARIAAKRLRADKMALVLGGTIHLYNTGREEFLQNEQWVKHELCHIRQYRRYGIAGFLLRYSWESLRKGYYKNKFEAEARQAEKSDEDD